MPTARALKVFVAMAFGHEDTDALYDKALKPLLTRVGDLRPIRVDRSDLNDPIDEQIYRFMKDSHLCIADLTYARPSVYYEAGWMRGIGKPVIFTCRADHLDRHKSAELADTQRVHFDLEQENIIGWNDNVYGRYRKRLQARLRRVMAPLLKRRDEDTRRYMEEAQLARLSLIRRCNILAQVGESCLRAAHFRRVTRNGSIVLASRGSGKSIAGIRLFVNHTFRKRNLEWCCYNDEDLTGIFHPDLVKIGCAELILISLNRVHRSTIESIFSTFEETTDGSTFIRVSDNMQIHWGIKVVHLIDHIKSERELRERLTAKLVRRSKKGT